MRVPVLTYHSNNIAGNDYANNDHVALAADLRMTYAKGLRVVALSQVVDALLGQAPASSVERAVAISFDDGSWFDWHDIDHPTCGHQRGFAGVLRDFSAATGAAVHATSFVIVSPDARAILDRTCLIGAGWWGDEWWTDAERDGVIAIENHSWDHNHATLPSSSARAPRKGSFLSIDNHADADAQIRQASDWLAMRLRPHRSRLFAYPYGESNDYLVREYLPRFEHEHGLRAAFGTEPKPIERGACAWTLPRYVCGEHWADPPAFAALLDEACG